MEISTINVSDGSCLKKYMGAGIILRNENGIFITGGSYYLGVGTNNLAELKAFYFNFLKALELNISTAIFEFDSKLVIKMLQGQISLAWQF